MLNFFIVMLNYSNWCDKTPQLALMEASIPRVIARRNDEAISWILRTAGVMLWELRG